MFKNKAVQVSVVKTNENPNKEHVVDMLDFEAEATIIADAVKHSVKTIVLGVCGFVVLDTIRQVLVTKASK